MPVCARASARSSVCERERGRSLCVEVIERGRKSQRVREGKTFKGEGCLYLAEQQRLSLHMHASAYVPACTRVLVHVARFNARARGKGEMDGRGQRARS